MSENSDPWDLPRTPESRDKLLSLAKDFRAEGKLREAGICYSRISHMLRWVGVEGEESWVGLAINLGTEAIELLRQTDDKAELARALRVTASAFHPEAQAMYEESLNIRNCRLLD